MPIACLAWGAWYASSVMQRNSGPSTKPTPIEIDGTAHERPGFLYPEQLTDDERAEMDHVLDVDGEAYLRWLAGEGPDPCESPK